MSATAAGSCPATCLFRMSPTPRAQSHVVPLRRTPGARHRAAAHGEPFPLSRRGRAELPFDRGLSAGATAAAVILATLVGAAVRLAATRNLSLIEIKNLDEAHTSFGTLISHLVHGGIYPPLHPALEWLMLKLVGNSAFAVRLPSLIAGIALVPATAWLAGEFFDRRTRIVAAAFTAFAPVLIWYSQEASGYALVALFGTLALVGAVRASAHGRTSDWALHTVAAALAVWSDWSGILIVLGTELLLALRLLERRQAGPLSRPLLNSWALASIALACQLVPLGALFAAQLHSSGGVAGVTNVSASGVTFYSTVSNFSWGLLGFHPNTVTSALSAVWPLAMLASLVSIGRGGGGRSWLLLAAALVPAVGVFILGLAVPGAFDVRYAVAAVPPALVLFARATTDWPRSQLGRVVVTAVVLLILVGALIDQQVDANNPRLYDFRPALAWVRAHARTASAVLYEPADFGIVVNRYGHGLHAAPLSRHLPTRARAHSLFVVTSFSNQAPLRALLNREIGALRATRHLVHYRRYPGVDVWWFR